MKLLSLLSLLLLGLLAASAQASIVDADCWNDGDGATNCQGSWNSDYSKVWITGNQYSGPAHMLGTVTASDPSDPTIGIFSTVNNDTAAAWSSYQVNVYMNNPFYLFGANITTPGNWTYTIDVSPAVSIGNGIYEAQLSFTGDTPINIGDSIDFSYDLHFSGATSYAFTQEMIPVEAPEPATMALLGLGLVGLLVHRRKK